jgi:hypothetical protein
LLKNGANDFFGGPSTMLECFQGNNIIKQKPPDAYFRHNNVALVLGSFTMNPTPLVGFRYSPEEVAVIQSIAQEAAELFPVGELYKNRDDLSQELNEFANRKGFAITTHGSKMCCTRFAEPLLRRPLT